MKRPVNGKVLSQHLEDAAFYWMRRQDGLWSPAFSKEDIDRLDRLVQSNLTGIRIAGPTAIPLAIENLNRWKSIDEVFVTISVMTFEGQFKDIDQVEQMLIDQPELAIAPIAALVWNANDSACELANRWWNSNEPVLESIGMSVLLSFEKCDAKAGNLIKNGIDRNALARAKAIRFSGELRLTELYRDLRSCFNDDDPSCAMEAAIALTLMKQKIGLSQLAEYIKSMKATSSDQNSDRKRALLTWSSYCSTQEFYNWQMAMIDESPRDVIWGMAFRGDVNCIPVLVDMINSDKEILLATYAICHITGLDIDKEGLFHHEENSEAQNSQHGTEEDEPSIEDDGLLEPDVPKLIEWLKRNKKRFQGDRRWLAGRSLKPDSLREILAQGTQPQRWQAAFELTRNGASELSNLASPMQD